MDNSHSSLPFSPPSQSFSPCFPQFMEQPGHSGPLPTRCRGPVTAALTQWLLFLLGYSSGAIPGFSCLSICRESSVLARTAWSVINQHPSHSSLSWNLSLQRDICHGSDRSGIEAMLQIFRFSLFFKQDKQALQCSSSRSYSSLATSLG